MNLFIVFCKTHSGFIVFHPSAPLCHEVHPSSLEHFDRGCKRLQRPQRQKWPGPLTDRSSNRFQTKLFRILTHFNNSEEFCLPTKFILSTFCRPFFKHQIFCGATNVDAASLQYQSGRLLAFFLIFDYDFWHCDAYFWLANIMSLCHDMMMTRLRPHAPLCRFHGDQLPRVSKASMEIQETGNQMKPITWS